MIYVKMFLTFFKIGLFTFGGGYAMIPMIQDEIIKQGWCDLNTLIDFIAVSESTPGPFAVNISTFIGNKTAGLSGAFTATAGVVLPSFIIIIIIAKFFIHFKDNDYMKAALGGLRPVVIGLIAAAAVSVISLALIPNTNGMRHIELNAAIIFSVTFALSKLIKKIHPIILIVSSAVLGILFYGII